MQDPICPFDQYDSYMSLTNISPERRIYKLQELIGKLPELNRVTLQFIVHFMREVVKYEPQNRMTSYNIAVTVGPNIFRPLNVRPADLFNAGTYYDVVIRLMEYYEVIFEGAPLPNADDFDLLAQADSIDKQIAEGAVGRNISAQQLNKAMGANSNYLEASSSQATTSKNNTGNNH